MWRRPIFQPFDTVDRSGLCMECVWHWLHWVMKYMFLQRASMVPAIAMCRSAGQWISTGYSDVVCCFLWEDGRVAWSGGVSCTPCGVVAVLEAQHVLLCCSTPRWRADRGSFMGVHPRSHGSAPASPPPAVLFGVRPLQLVDASLQLLDVGGCTHRFLSQAV